MKTKYDTLSLLAYRSITSSQRSIFLPECRSTFLHLHAKLAIFSVKLGYEFQIYRVMGSVGYILEIALALISQRSKYLSV